MRGALKVALCLALASRAWGAFSFQRTLTVTSNATLLPSTQPNFPVLVSITDNSLKTAASAPGVGHVQNASGFDINFFSDSGRTTLLNWEMEFYDPTNGVVIAWVKIPSLSLGLQFFMAYGDPTINTFQGGATGAAWDANFKGVWHMPNGTTLSTADSTANANSIVNTGGTAASGMVDGGYGLTTAQYGEAPSAALTQTTYEAWIKFTALPAAGDNGSWVVGMADASIPPGSWSNVMGVNSSGKVINYWFNGSANTLTGVTTLSTGTWYYIVTTANSGTTDQRVYVNGALDAGPTAGGTIFSGWASGPKIAVGLKTSANPNSFTNGISGTVDEVRVSNLVRGPDWIKASYNSQNAPGTFLALGTETPISSGGAPARMLLGVGGF